MRRVLSRDAETKIKLPLGVKLRSLTTSWWPDRFKSRSPSEREGHSIRGRGSSGLQVTATPLSQLAAPLVPDRNVHESPLGPDPSQK